MRLGESFFIGSSIPDRQLFGMEVELENVNSGYEGIRGWRDIEDGSLRNAGMEFITRPVTQNTLLGHITRLYGHIRNNHWEANERTGIHLHVDMRKYNLEQVESVLTAYCLAEPGLYRMCGSAREENIYCIPWYRAPDEIDKWRRARRAHTRIDEVVQHVASRANKYSGLYLEPMYRFGSIEFRMAPTWTDGATTARWVKVVSELIAYAVAREGRHVIEDFSNNGADRWARHVMPSLEFDYNMDHLCTYYGVEELADSMAGYEHESSDEWVMGNHGGGDVLTNSSTLADGSMTRRMTPGRSSFRTMAVENLSVPSMSDMPPPADPIPIPDQLRGMSAERYRETVQQLNMTTLNPEQEARRRRIMETLARFETTNGVPTQTWLNDLEEDDSDEIDFDLT